LKKLRENEKKKKELIRLERSKKLEIARAKRTKRMKKSVENDQDNQKQVDEENGNEEDENNEADATKNNSQDDQSGSESLTASQSAKSTETQKNQHRLQKQQQPVKMKRFRRTKQQILLDKQLAMQNTLNRQIQKMKSPISSPTKKSVNAVALPRTINKNNNNYNTATNNSSNIDANINTNSIPEPNFYGIPIIQSVNRRRKKVYRTKPKNCAKIKSKEFILDDDDEDEESEEESSFVSSNGQKTVTNSPTRTPSQTNTPKQSGKQSEDEEEEDDESDDEEEEEEGNDEKNQEDEENEQDEEEEEDEDVSTLFRKCLVCKAKVHQDFLADHCGDHYYESPKCKRCDKISSNPSNYVTHILSHLSK